MGAWWDGRWRGWHGMHAGGCGATPWTATAHAFLCLQFIALMCPCITACALALRHPSPAFPPLQRWWHTRTTCRGTGGGGESSPPLPPRCCATLRQLRRPARSCACSPPAACGVARLYTAAAACPPTPLTRTRLPAHPATHAVAQRAHTGGAGPVPGAVPVQGPAVLGRALLHPAHAAAPLVQPAAVRGCAGGGGGGVCEGCREAARVGGAEEGGGSSPTQA